MKLSAGILLYRIKEGQLQVFLVYPGGPFFKKKDKGWRTIPKGEVMEAEICLMPLKKSTSCNAIPR